MEYVKTLCSRFYTYEAINAVFRKTFRPVIIDNLNYDGITQPPTPSHKKLLDDQSYNEFVHDTKGRRKSKLYVHSVTRKVTTLGRVQQEKQWQIEKLQDRKMMVWI